MSISTAQPARQPLLFFCNIEQLQLKHVVRTKRPNIYRWRQKKKMLIFVIIVILLIVSIICKMREMNSDLFSIKRSLDNRSSIFDTEHIVNLIQEHISKNVKHTFDDQIKQYRNEVSTEITTALEKLKVELQSCNNTIKENDVVE